MILNAASRSSGSRQQLLRLLLVSSHSQQQAAAAARAYATDGARDEDSQRNSGQLDHITSRDLYQQDSERELVFDAARASQPLRVHQLIGDPRTGVADDTTAAPFSKDLKVEHVFEDATDGTNWFRYSMAGNHLPYMYMDSRLSDHSKNMMYMLRCKDPQRWTIPALAEKFRIRRQRVMAILALKEIQAHKIGFGESMPGPLQHYVYKVPLDDFMLDTDGQPKDLLQLIQEQEAMQQQQQQQGSAAAVQTLESTEGLGRLEDFLAPDGQQEAAAAAASSSSISRSDQQADLAVLMPQLALTAQQLQVQLLQLLQSHHYSIPELQRRLMQQIDVAEAYYKAHIQGTPLEQLLLASSDTQQPAAAATAGQPEAAAEGDQDAAEGADAAAAKPVFLNFDLQRQAVQQLLGSLEPLLAAAGPQKERESGRMVIHLQRALGQHAGSPPPAADTAAAEAAGAEQQQGLAELVAAADPATLVAAFNRLTVEQRQQLVDAVPDARIILNIQGTDLRAVLSASSSSSSSTDDASAANSSSSSSSGLAEWPGQVPTLVDVWGHEEVPRQQLAAVQQALPDLQGLLEGVDSLSSLAGASSSSSSSSRMSAEDISAVQQAVNVYAGLLLHYDAALTDQAILATDSDGAMVLPASNQRRLARILDEVDPNALKKLLFWESVYREEAEAAEGDDTRRANRLRKLVQAKVKALDKQAAASGYRPVSAEYPELPASVPAEARVDHDMRAAELEAQVVGRQFHRGSGDKPWVSVPTYPKFEGLSLEEFDAVSESEISIINRLAAERQDNVMWREFRAKLLRNMGLLAPDLAQHSGVVKPPKPAEGWSWVVHPVGGASKAQTRERLAVEREMQWEDEQVHQGAMAWYQAVDLQQQKPVKDPARGPSPASAYVAEPGGKFRGLNEEEAMVVGDTRPKPRSRWFTGRKG